MKITGRKKEREREIRYPFEKIEKMLQKIAIVATVCTILSKIDFNEKH